MRTTLAVRESFSLIAVFSESSSCCASAMLRLAPPGELARDPHERAAERLDGGRTVIAPLGRRYVAGAPLAPLDDDLDVGDVLERFGQVREGVGRATGHDDDVAKRGSVVRPDRHG